MTTFEITLDDTVYKKLLGYIKLFRLITGRSISRDLLIEACIECSLENLGEEYIDFLEKEFLDE